MQSQRFGTAKQILLLALAIGLWGFIIYIRWFAAPATLLFLGATQIDKIAHFSGGIFIAMLAEWKLKRANLPLFIFALVGIAISWEVLEFFFDAETKFFYGHAPDLWRLDSSGDILAAILGGYGHWAFLMNRNGSNADRQRGSYTD